MFSQFTYQQIIVTPIVAFPSCSSSFLGRQRICFSKYFSPFPPQVFFSSTKICSLLQIFSALSFFVFLNLHKRDILFLTSIKEIFYISIYAVKRLAEELQFYRSIYLLIDIKIAEGGRADLFLAKSLPSGSSTYTAGRLTHFGEGEKCFHKSITCTFNHSLYLYKYYNEILLKYPGNHIFLNIGFKYFLT